MLFCAPDYRKLMMIKTSSRPCDNYIPTWLLQLSVGRSACGTDRSTAEGPKQSEKPVQSGKSSAGFLIIIMEVCKAPTLRFKALNKRDETHIMYIEMKKVSRNLTKANA